MSQSDMNLTPAQRALQELAIRQMTALLESLRRLDGITVDQGDRAAVQDASGSLNEAVEVLRGWFGQEPVNDFL